MNPIFYKNGPLELHVFSLWIMLVVTIGVETLLLTAHQRGKRGTWFATLAPWLDCAFAAVIGGIVGARLGHVWLNWDYFSAHTDQIRVLQTGGLDWHGAVILGLAAVIPVALLRRIPLKPLLDALALALPFGAMCVWQASTLANATYGLEVRTLADFPSWLVIESPDVYGSIAPRLNLLPAGLALSALVLFVVVTLFIWRKLPENRLWLALTLLSLGMAVIDVFRADYVPIWLDHRADQILDLSVGAGAIFIFAIVAIMTRARLPSFRHIVPEQAG